MTELILFRHGQTDWNIKNVMQGITDTSLNKYGIRQVKDSVNSLPKGITKIVTSPLLRAVESARIIDDILHIGVDMDSRLIERDFGNLTGLDIDKAYSLIGKKDSICESTYSMMQRVEDFLNEYKNRDGRFLIISHGAIILQIQSILDNANYTWQDYPIQNCTSKTVVI